MYGGGKSEKKKLRAGRGAVGKTAAVGMKNRDTNAVTAQMVAGRDHLTLIELRHGTRRPRRAHLY